MQRWLAEDIVEVQGLDGTNQLHAGVTSAAQDRNTLPRLTPLEPMARFFVYYTFRRVLL
jgi:hypothetical protein